MELIYSVVLPAIVIIIAYKMPTISLIITAIIFKWYIVAVGVFVMTVIRLWGLFKEYEQKEKTDFSNDAT
jgi:hypothetical protein